MTARRPLVRIGSKTTQLPSGDSLDKAIVGLNLVDNTPDKDKPPSDPTVLAMSVAGAQNLIYNSSFDKVGTNGYADGWSGSVTGGAARTATQVTSTLDPSGLAQRYDLTGLTASTSVYAQLYLATANLVPFAPGLPAMGSMYFKATAGLNVQMALEFWDTGSTNLLLRTAFVSIIATGDWQRINQSGVSPVNTAGVQVLIRVSGSSTLAAGFIEFDKAQVQQSTVLSAWNLSTGPLDTLGASNVNLLPAEYTVFGANPPANTSNSSTTTVVADATAAKGYALNNSWTVATTAPSMILAKDFSLAACNMVLKRQKYIISFKAKASVAGHIIGCYLRTYLADNASTLTSAAPTVTLTDTWAKYSVVIDMTGSQWTGTQMALVMQTNRSAVANRSVQFDQIMVEPVLNNITEPSGFVPGSSFDQSVSLAAAIVSAMRQFYLDGAGIGTSPFALDNTYTGRWVSITLTGAVITMPSAATMQSGQTIRLLNRASGSITLNAFGTNGLVVNQVSFATITLAAGEWFEFAANTGNTAWYAVGHGFLDQKSILPTLSELGSQNVAFNSAMRLSKVTDVADGWKFDAPGAPGASTGAMTRVVSFINPDEFAQRFVVTNLNVSSLYRSLTNDGAYPGPFIAEGQDATVSTYVKGTAGLGVRIFIQAVNASGTLINTVNGLVNVLDGTAQRISLTYANLPANTVRLQVYFRIYASTATDGTVDFARPQFQNGPLSGWREDSKAYTVKGADQTLLASNVNWDTITTPDDYSVPAATGVNAPSSGPNFLVKVRKTGTSIKQEAMTLGDANTISRVYSGGSWSGWFRTISNFGIVGTVSQVGGLMSNTSAIIERGSNANGEYTKFADGTMQCLAKVAATTAMTANGVTTVPVTLPAAFVDTNYAALGKGQPSTTYAGFCTSTVLVSSTTACQVVFLNGATAQNVGAIVVMCYGRWY